MALHRLFTLCTGTLACFTCVNFIYYHFALDAKDTLDKRNIEVYLYIPATYFLCALRAATEEITKHVAHIKFKLRAIAVGEL